MLRGVISGVAAAALLVSGTVLWHAAEPASVEIAHESTVAKSLATAPDARQALTLEARVSTAIADAVTLAAPPPPAEVVETAATDSPATASPVDPDWPAPVSPPLTALALAELTARIEAGGGLIADYGPTLGVETQMEYAYIHWNNYNTAQFGDFNPMGGDCVNFVSQTLIARGIPMMGDWYNYVDSSGVRRWTASFVHVPSFDAWIGGHHHSVKVQFSQRDRIKVGDVAVFDWNNNNSLDHAMVVADVYSLHGQIKVALIGHNNDHNYRDLDGVLNGTGGTGYIWSIGEA